MRYLDIQMIKSFEFDGIFAFGLLLLCVLVFQTIRSWNRPVGPGHIFFLMTHVGVSGWLAMTILQVATVSTLNKIFLYTMTMPMTTLCAAAWSVFLIKFGPVQLDPLRRFAYPIVVIPTFSVTILALTNGWHEWIISLDSQATMVDGRISITPDRGWMFYLIEAHNFGWIALATGVSLYGLRRATNYFKPIYGAILAMSAVPIGTNISYLLFDFTVAGVDPTPYVIVISFASYGSVLINSRLMKAERVGERHFFYASDSLKMIFNQKGRMVSMNPVAKEMLSGGDAKEMKAMVDGLAAKLMKAGRINQCFVHIVGDRSYHANALVIEDVVHPDRKPLGWTINLTDVTREEEAARQLQAAKEKAEATVLLQTELVSVISHELRTPLTSISGTLDLMHAGGFGALPDKAARGVEIARRNTRRLRNLIDNLLDLQKLDSGEFKVSFEKVDLKNAVQIAAEDMRGYGLTRNVGLKVVDPVEPCICLTNMARLQQVLANVVSNAMKFSGDGDLVTISTSRIKDFAEIRITDTGPGIPVGSEEKVFGRFSQIDSSATRSHEGTGLGMNISSLLLQELGGHIHYESELGVGTTFFVRIPLHDSEQAEVSA
ncbi:Signal transduction histidine kinase [Loktanella sp. DSM 29012]|uniref:sensor histidine kinase n=1 Tax=Loktanella sp. DSM 29012 TaxID=1881056 RepID=UPI0008D8AF21|nr:ATP-binding protein [Loktanella sp. DSM 29012]SEQ58835.1 Signal transduction histidine kinase [Loktanella sp. DSM 29012]